LFEKENSQSIHSVRLFDYTVEKLPTPIEKGKFFKKGSSRVSSGDFITLHGALATFESAE
jgi:hypothetical protein